MGKRKLLVVGTGAIVITVLEGIACGNPVAPRCPGGTCTPMPVDAAKDGAVDTTTVAPDAGVDAPIVK